MLNCMHMQTGGLITAACNQVTKAHAHMIHCTRAAQTGSVCTSCLDSCAQSAHLRSPCGAIFGAGEELHVNVQYAAGLAHLQAVHMHGCSQDTCQLQHGQSSQSASMHVLSCPNCTACTSLAYACATVLCRLATGLPSSLAGHDEFMPAGTA